LNPIEWVLTPVNRITLIKKPMTVAIRIKFK